MKKKIISLIIAMSMFVSSAVPVYAENETTTLDEENSVIITSEESLISEEQQEIGEEVVDVVVEEGSTEDDSMQNVEMFSNDVPVISYTAHVSDIGWQAEKENGATAGTTGKNKKLEAVKISVKDFSGEGGVEYRAHVAEIGWQEWKQDGEISGTTGKNLAIEAVQIQLTGSIAESFDIYYRMHVSNFGWLGWAKNGEIAGTTGWAYQAEAIEICLVEKGGTAPGTTENHYRPAIWNMLYEQQEETTMVEVFPEVIEEIIAEKAATAVSITATMSYNGNVTRKITAEKSIQEIKEGGFAIDFGTYGKFNVVATFKKDGKVVATKSQTVNVIASEYNLAPISATFPVVLFSLSIWDINVNENGKAVPTIVMLDRPSAYNWGALPDGVYAMPYLSEQEIQQRGKINYTAYSQYVKDLYEISPNAKFNLYINDITCSYIQEVIYANKIPEGQYTITLMSDGSASYSIFNETYSGTDPKATHQELIALWNEAKQYAYTTGQVKSGWGWHAHWDSIYAILDCESVTEWWVGRDNLFTSGDDNAFANEAKSKVTKKSISTMLTALENKGDETVQTFKALYNFNDGYFADAEEQGKEAMVLLGTYVNNEPTFENYARLTKLYYGDEYLYYYKGHPNTPTGLWPEKQEQLEKLGITDIDSNVAAELILFFNPEISLSGYGSTTFNSASEDMACGLFATSKENALADGVSIDYSGIDWFATEITSDSDSEILALCPSGSTCYLLEFSDAILEEGNYDFAIFNATKGILKFYKKEMDSYNVAKTLAEDGTVSYQAHVADIGWQTSVSEGKTAGTVGKAKAMEALTINLGSVDYDGSIEYRAHVSNLGWLDWVTEGEIAGTVGKALAMEAISIRLTGELAEKYDIYYRVHVSNLGWLDWAKNGENAGSAGYAYAMEAIEIQLIEKGKDAPGKTDNAYVTSQITYQAHVTNIGWQSVVKESGIAGTVGKALSIEAIKIQLKNAQYSGSVEYRTHVSNVGWQSWKKDGALSGTTGRALQTEAISIRLTGEMKEHYDIYYRVQVQDYGWLDWAKNGENAGTEGLAKQMEAIQIILVEKGKDAPGNTQKAFIIK